MRNYKQVEKTELVLDNITCDSCGEICQHNECMELKVNWGYHSNKDMTTWTADICENCVDSKFGFIKFNKQETIMY